MDKNTSKEIPQKKFQDANGQKYFLSFIFSSAPPPLFSSRYLKKCYNIVYFGRGSMSERVAGGREDDVRMMSG